MKWCHSIDEIPKEPHYAILEQRSINIPGDERSRTNPGHGYPASTEEVWDYIVFNDSAEWEAGVKTRAESRFGSKNFVAISATPASIRTTVHVEFKK